MDSDRAPGGAGFGPVDAGAWLRSPQVRTHHRRAAHASPERLWETAEGVRLADARRLGRLVRWRIPGLADELTFRDLFRAYPFALLDEGPGWSVSGMCGRIWTLRRDYPRLEGAEAFRAWRAHGTVRVLFAHWVEPASEGAAIVSEARVEALDRVAALRLRGLWAIVGVFERLIGAEPLEIAVRRAEGRG